MDIQEFSEYVEGRLDEQFDRYIALWVVTRQMLFAIGVTDDEKKHILDVALNSAADTMSSSSVLNTARRDRVVSEIRALAQVLNVEAGSEEDERNKAFLSVIQGGRSEETD